MNLCKFQYQLLVSASWILYINVLKLYPRQFYLKLNIAALYFNAYIQQPTTVNSFINEPENFYIW